MFLQKSDKPFRFLKNCTLMCFASKPILKHGAFPLLSLPWNGIKISKKHDRYQEKQQDGVHLFCLTKKGHEIRLHRQIWPKWKKKSRRKEGTAEVENGFLLMGSLKLTFHPKYLSNVVKHIILLQTVCLWGLKQF